MESEAKKSELRGGAQGKGEKKIISAQKKAATKLVPPRPKDELALKAEHKKLPETVRAEVEKALKVVEMSWDNEKAIAERYVNTLLEIPWLESSAENRDL